MLLSLLWSSDFFIFSTTTKPLTPVDNTFVILPKSADLTGSVIVLLSSIYEMLTLNETLGLLAADGYKSSKSSASLSRIIYY